MEQPERDERRRKMIEALRQELADAARLLQSIAELDDEDEDDGNGGDDEPGHPYPRTGQ